MRAARLAAALDAGVWTLPPAGDIAVWGPRAGDDLSALPAGRVVVVTGFRPDYDHFAAAGFRTATDLPEAAATLVCLPRARDAGRAIIAAAARQGPVAVDGQKDDGIDSMRRALAARGHVSEAVAKAHGKLFTFTGDLADWLPSLRDVDGMKTRPGVFSADGPDPGSALLAAALPEKLPAQMADLGAGWGYLSAAVLARQGVAALHLVEADHASLACARDNVTDPRAQFHWADATLWKPPVPLGGVVMNPPFHVGRSADPGLGLAFLHAAHRMLAPGGSLWMVSNRHLPYEAPLAALFREVTDLPGTSAYRLTLARAPRRNP